MLHAQGRITILETKRSFTYFLTQRSSLQTSREYVGAARHIKRVQAFALCFFIDIQSDKQ